jgi:hypothetical protein
MAGQSGINGEHCRVRRRRGLPHSSFFTSSFSLVALALIGSLIMLPADASAAPTQWSVTLSHHPGLRNSSLTAVSCIDPTHCMAVGRTTSDGDVTHALIEAWNGSRWSITDSPDSGSFNALNGVSCVPGTDFCEAVGSFDTLDDGAAQGHTLAELWDGTTWAVAPSPGNAQATLKDVSCVSPTFCVAVGYEFTTIASRTTLRETWDGDAWTIDSTLSPSVDGELNGVSCVSTMACIAVGTDSEGALVETWDGAHWSVMPNADSGTDHSDLAAVSCTDVRDCVAVGDDKRVSGIATLVESWNGISWSLGASPNPGRDDSGLSGVSCAATSDCTSVGHQKAATLVETWDGIGWTVAPSPSPGNTGNDLTGISCINSTSCIAVGYTSGYPGRHRSRRSAFVALAESGSDQPPAATPEVPMPLLLPLVGLLVFGAAYGSKKRRSLRR